MTNKEALVHALEPIEMDETGGKMLPMAFPWFIQQMAALLVYCAEKSLTTDVQDVTIDGEKTSGKAVERPSFVDYFGVLHFDDLMRAVPLNFQLHGFLAWWLEQEFKTDDIRHSWCDFDTITENWNEYANITNGGRT